MTYHQLTLAERYRIVTLRGAGWWPTAIARALRRHPSTIIRELARNRAADRAYRAYPAECRSRTRRQTCRRSRRLTDRQWRRITRYLRQGWSPEQIAGALRQRRQCRVSHETIYDYRRADRRAGGSLYRLLRYAHRQRRRRVGRVRRQGPLGRPLTTRHAHIETRQQCGHWEIDTMLGTGSRDSLLSAIERATGYVVVGKLAAHTAAAFAARAIPLFRAQPRPVRTITADNGSEISGYRTIERATGTQFFFATPYHAWERGTNENTNGLIRQYLPKGQTMAHLTQRDCKRIARQLNQRPRKRLGYRTPEECYVPQALHFSVDISSIPRQTTTQLGTEAE